MKKIYTFNFNVLLFLFFIGVSFIAKSQDIPIPVHYYDFEENINDLGTGKNNGTIEGDEVVFNTGGIIANMDDSDGCIEFEVSGDDNNAWGNVGYVRIPNSDVINSPNMTFTCWLKWNTEAKQTFGYIIWNGGDDFPPADPRTDRLDMWWHGPMNRFISSPQASPGNPQHVLHTETQNDSIYSGDWHLFGLTYETVNGEMTMTAYLDAIEAGSMVLNGGLPESTKNDIWLGSRPNTDGTDINMIGFIDRVRFWDVALTSEQFQLLFNIEGPDGGIEDWPWIKQSIADNSNKRLKTQVYPNPVLNVINIESSQNLKQINIISIDGKLIKSLNTRNKNVQINTSDLSSGVYFVQIENEYGQKNVRKIIK